MVMPQHERKVGALGWCIPISTRCRNRAYFFEDAESNGNCGGRYSIQWKHRNDAFLQNLHAKLAKESTVNVPP